MVNSSHWREETHNKSRKFILSLLLLFVIIFAYLLIFHQYTSIFTHEIYSNYHGYILFLCWFIYIIRVLYSLYCLLPRSCPWGEVLAVPLFLYIILLSSILGPLISNTWNNIYLDSIGIILYILGSFITTYSEQTRAWWKWNRNNKGKLYTLALFSIIRHPNYLGDFILFLGLWILTRVWWNIWFPIIMLLGFIFTHIPDNEEYLSSKYSNEWKIYIKNTKYKLIPFIY